MGISTLVMKFSAAAISLIVIILVFIGVFSYFFGRQWIDSDHSSEMVLAGILADENTLVSSSWLYGNELRLVYQTIFTMPLFKLLGRLDNWALIRAINIVLNNIVLFFSYLFMMKQFNVKTKWILFSGIFLFMPVSIEYWNIVTFGGYYIFFIIQLFFCLGLYIRLLSHEGAVKTHLAESSFFSAISLVLGIQGIRPLLFVFFPLLLTCAILYKTEKKRFSLFLGCYAFILSCAGYFINNLLHYKFSFLSFGNMRMENSSIYLEKLGMSFIYMMDFFGFKRESMFFSSRGFFSIAAMAATVLLIILVFRTAKKKLFMPLFFACSAAFNIFIFIIVNRPITLRFFLPFMILYVPLAAFLFEYTGKTLNSVRHAAVICGITVFIAGQSILNFSDLYRNDINMQRKGYVQYLLDEDLEFGFATYWNANVTTELSNGKIQVAGLLAGGRTGGISGGRTGGSGYRLSDFLIPKKYHDPHYHEGEAFLLLERSEWDSIRGRSFAKKEPAFADGKFVIIRFPSAEIIYNEFL